MKKLFVSTLLTAMAVPVMFAQTAKPATDTKPTTTATTKSKKHAKKTTAPAASTKMDSSAPKN